MTIEVPMILHAVLLKMATPQEDTVHTPHLSQSHDVLKTYQLKVFKLNLKDAATASIFSETPLSPSFTFISTTGT